MACQTANTLTGVESLGDDAVEQEHYVADLVLQTEINDTEIVVGVKHI